jgi:hypothetical protein
MENDEFKNKIKVYNDTIASTPAKIVEIQTKIYDVYEFYIDIILHQLRNFYKKNNIYLDNKIGFILSGIFRQSKLNAKLEKNLVELAFLLIIAIMEGEVLSSDKNSSILVFLPGVYEIIDFEINFKIMLQHYLTILSKNSNQNIEELKMQQKFNLKICQLHSGISE